MVNHEEFQKVIEKWKIHEKNQKSCEKSPWRKTKLKIKKWQKSESVFEELGGYK